LKVNIPDPGSQGPLHLLIDSTGIKVKGEGEWNARKHGGAKRRLLRKILAQDGPEIAGHRGAAPHVEDRGSGLVRTFDRELELYRSKGLYHLRGQVRELAQIEGLRHARSYPIPNRKPNKTEPRSIR
jgi:hypothetical protein